MQLAVAEHMEQQELEVQQGVMAGQA